MPQYSALWKQAVSNSETETLSGSGEHFVHASHMWMFELDPRKQPAHYGFLLRAGPGWDPSGQRGRGNSTRVRRLCGKSVDCLKEKTRLQKKAVKALKISLVFSHN